ncbi:MAG: sugar ABC transporter permease [Thermoplasmata archaeon]
MKNDKGKYYRRIRMAKRIVSHLFLILIVIFSIFPIYYVLLMSLSPLSNLSQMSVEKLIPNLTYLTTSNYGAILYHYPFLTWLKNTLIFSASATFFGVLLAISSGLALSRMNIPLRKVILYMMLILSLFPFVIMVIPFYFMFSELGLVNSYTGLIIAYSAGAVIFASWLIKNYVEMIPKDFEEAAQIDGYTKTGALFRVVLPIAKPVVIFALVLSFMGPYTDYALAGQLLTNPDMYTMAIGMYYVSQGTVSMNYGTYSAFAVLMGIPIFLLFFAFQRYLVSGFSIAMYK